MSNNETNLETVIGQRQIVVPGLDLPVTVREMKWGDAIAFVRLLSKELAGLIGVDAAGRASLNLGKLPEIVASSDTLTTALVTASTGLTPEALASLPASSALEVLEAAVDMNLTEALLGKLRRIGGKVAGAFGAAPTPPAPPAAEPTP